MRRRSTEIKVGVAVVAAVVILGLGVMWIEKVSFKQKFVSYAVYFDDVGGLEARDPVTVAGVDAGEVGAVVLEPERVRVEVLIDDRIELYDDAVAEIFTIGLMGEKYIAISRGTSGNVLPPGSVLRGKYKAGMAEAIAGAGYMIEELAETVRAFRALVETEGQGASLAATMRRMDELTAEILAILRENRAAVKSTAASMERISADVDSVFGSRKKTIARGIDDFANAAARLDSITVSVEAVMRAIEEGRGTAGMLVYEKSLHEDLERVLDNISALIEDIKADPHKYFKVEIF